MNILLYLTFVLPLAAAMFTVCVIAARAENRRHPTSKEEGN